MSDALLDAAETAIPIEVVAEAELATALEKLGGQAAGLAETESFKAKSGQALKLPGGDGKTARVLLGLGAKPKADVFRTAAGRLPAGDYRLQAAPEGLSPTDIAVAWGLGAYRYDRYKPAKEGPARLVLPEGANAQEARAIAHACALARDMINTPANDMGPLQIETIAREIAEQYRRRDHRDHRRRLLEAELSGRPRRRPRRRPAPRAADDRDHLGRGGAPLVASSARAWCSTPAASTSSPRPACG